MISIIVPVYNVEKYISKCINSIINQTITDWELILIDDGSKDKSGLICDQFAINDTRIKVIHKDNEGVSKARNIGIDNANGEYICFIDSDDWIDSTFLEDFKTKEFKCDFYISGALYDTYNKVYSYKKYNKIFCKDKTSIRDEAFKQDLISNGYPWGKLYKTIIIKNNKLRFNENLTINEDHIFVFEFLSYINNLYITNSAGYHYTVFDDSGRKLSGKINTYNELKTASEQFNIIIDRLKSLWNISEADYIGLINIFVHSKRFLAFRSLILLKEKNNFKNELKYWKECTYIGNNKLERILLYILRSKYIICKYNLCKLIFVLKQKHNKDRYTNLIFSDLNKRSVKL